MRAIFTGSKSPRITPADGEAFLISAMRLTSLRGPARDGREEVARPLNVPCASGKLVE